MVGKTAKEVARIASDLYKGMLAGGQPQQPQPQYQQQYQPQYMQPQYQMQQQYPQQPQGPQMPSDEDWNLNPRQAMEQYTNYLKTTQFDPALQQQWNTTGLLALQIAQRDHKDAFDRWGPEIMGLYNQLPPESRANPQNIDTIVKMVRGNHVMDMQREMEERIRKDMEAKFASGGNLRPDTTAGVVPADTLTLESAQEELPPNYARLLRENHITDATLTEFLLTQGRDLFPGNTLADKKKAWMEMAKQGDVITERGFKYDG